MARGSLCVTLALCLLVNTFGLPTDVLRLRRDNENSIDVGSNSKETGTSSTPDPFDDDDDFAEPVSTSSGGGSSIFSLLNLATALFPGSSGSTTTIKLRKILQKLLIRSQSKLHLPIRRQSNNHVIEIDYATQLKPPPPPQFEKQVSDESDSSASSESSDSSSESTENNGNASTASDENGASDSRSDENNAAEESVESTNDNGNSAKQSSDSNSSDSEEEDYSDEIPGGDGQGGGILGLLAGLSGGENGESDLGSLLAAFSGIVVNLSGDGLDLNSLIASGIGLFVGLLSEGEENPGSVLASYLLTSLDTITGGGSKNNGAFFGNLISKLVKGTSAAGESESSEEESNENKMPMADSAGFIISLLMSILGDMSKGSSDGSNAW